MKDNFLPAPRNTANPNRKKFQLLHWRFSFQGYIHSSQWGIFKKSCKSKLNLKFGPGKRWKVKIVGLQLSNQSIQIWDCGIIFYDSLTIFHISSEISATLSFWKLKLSQCNLICKTAHGTVWLNYTRPNISFRFWTAAVAEPHTNICRVRVKEGQTCYLKLSSCNFTEGIL